MKPSYLDLRITNKVYNIASGNKEVCEIEAITRLGVQYNSETKQGTCSMDNLEPIVLTEEWLLNLGFEKIFDSSFFNLILPHKYKVYISISLELESYQVCQSGNGFSIDAKYVHQLQNLYYSLTGNEIIKQNP